jgi:hypothetical protein
VLNRQDFVFTIGYDGPAAVVDSHARGRYGGLSTRELAEKGLFRAAYSSAVYSKDPAELRMVVEIYSAGAGISPDSIASPERLFGVFPVDVKRSVLL